MSETLTSYEFESSNALEGFQIDFEPLNEQDPAAGKPLHFSDNDLGQIAMGKHVKTGFALAA